MCSECSNPKHVPSFLEGVLDPQPCHNVGSFSKANFLIGRTFLTQVYFPGWSALYKLIYDLAGLFVVNQVDQVGSDGILQRVHKDVYSDEVSTHETKLNTKGNGQTRATDSAP